MTFFHRLLAAFGLGSAVKAANLKQMVLPEGLGFDPTPDLPEPFGYKVSWFAVSAADPTLVLDALGLGPGFPANWKTGIAAAYRGRTSADNTQWLFVSPPVKGWVFVVGCGLPYPVFDATHQHNGAGQKFEKAFTLLTTHFSEVQFFGSYRVVDFVSWARAQKGRAARMFAYGDGEVFANVGDQTSEEASLGFPNLNGLPPRDATERLFSLEDALSGEADLRAFPSESDVLKLAALWSLAPDQFPYADSSLGCGVAVELPKEMGQ